MHWFQKCNFWNNSLTRFRGRWGRRGQTTSKPKTTKILNTKLIKIRWNPKFGLRDLENGLLTSGTSEGAQWIFPKNTFYKSGKSTEKNEQYLGFLVKLLKLPLFNILLASENTEVCSNKKNEVCHSFLVNIFTKLRRCDLQQYATSVEKTLEEMGPEQLKCLPLKGTNNHSWFCQQYEGVQVA